MSMDIRAPAGTKVRFTGEGGYPYHQSAARECMNVGDVLTVAYTDIDAWHTDVFFKEIPGRGFNSVMFEEVSLTSSQRT